MDSRGTPVRKLTARSAILSALLGAHPAEAPVSWIVRVAVGLGLQESAVRAALTRMVAGGDLERRDSAYRLAPRLIERQHRQDEAMHPPTGAWDGTWQLAIVTVGADDSTDRAAFREVLRAKKFGELREGVWTRPDNLGTDFPAAAARRLTVFTGHPGEPDGELAERLFRPDAWAENARLLLSAMAQAEFIGDRFEVAAATVRHILNDPMLPTELLPRQWPGYELRASYVDFRAEFAEFAEALMGSTVPRQR
ncbi:PaaX family transcriptional regulator C-terminal domain-containing protein [Nocardia xishanensis]|uniref:PaaX family transcriptional regulator C-terminal domain-containing protein n=1 Tax=Nocardia xishanensis TaxID=238964 RepID=UPI000830EDC4|nr:PaaX family transcriptional regulator C-terminal domain-containing protein [Nocardia xishanensis]